jgi:two-component system sensor histidine kinase/response regulator
MEKVGLSAFLTKPVKKNHLFECLRLALATTSAVEGNSDLRIITRYTIEENKSIQPVPENNPAEAAQEDHAKPSWRILLAEDNLMNQKVAGKMLSKMGHTVVIANNGKEAVEAFQQEQLDLILIDGQMPEMSGLEATAEIRKLEAGRSHIPIVAATAAALIGDRQRFLDGGMDEYVSKPLDRKKLEEVITKVILG